MQGLRHNFSRIERMIIHIHSLIYVSRNVGGGRKAGTITTQGESACSRQQAETPTGC